MLEIFDKIKERLKNHPYVFSQHGCEYGNIPLDSVFEVIDQVKNEYMNNQIFQYAIAYATTLSLYGVDIRDKWETLTHQMDALHQAYIRGRKDERDEFMEWADKKWN